MRLLVFGSRGFPVTPGRAQLFQALRAIRTAQKTEGLHIIAGHSVDRKGDPIGPDWWAEQWAITYEYAGVTRTIISIASIGGWDAFPGKKAAYVRNKMLRDDGKPTHALSLWNGKSGGTKMMMHLVEQADWPILKCLIIADANDFTIEWADKWPTLQKTTKAERSHRSTSPNA
jgi:hypothetical protein